MDVVLKTDDGVDGHLDQFSYLRMIRRCTQFNAYERIAIVGRCIQHVFWPINRSIDSREAIQTGDILHRKP